MSRGLKKGDKVVVLAGKDKGKSGRILRFTPESNMVIVEGVNLVKKHMRRRSEAESGGIKEIPAPLNCSNVALYCPHCNRGVRFSMKVMKDKTKARVCSKCQKDL